MFWAGVLAAGEGRRMGQRAKALLRLADMTFVEAIATTARRGGVDAVAVVTGYHAEDVEATASRCCDIVVRNHEPSRGMASSARTLAGALPEAASLLLWPVDMPRVRAQTVRLLLETARRTPGRVIVPLYKAPGHPPVIPSGVVDALRTMPDGVRLDRFLEGEGGIPLLLEVDDPAVVHDVDRPEDLEAVFE